ncbi:MAG TPA: TetR family transcriptional regulator [Acidimicrobiales bacterium]|nr:TetR family transcriptional regulator [Acidimicrobiales bacterium]
MATEEDELRAVDGRVPGRRGLATRQRLLDETAAQLDKSSFRDLKVIDIARDAGTSPATFYQYFADIESAVLALAEQMVEASPLAQVIESTAWTDAAALAGSFATVDAFLGFFAEYQPVLRVVDLLMSEGDDRFGEVRARMLNPAARELSAIVERHQGEGRHADGVDPMAHAGVLVTMLAHIAGRQPAFEHWGIGPADLRNSLARQLCWGVTGLSPQE